MRCHLLMKDGNLKVQRRGVTFSSLRGDTDRGASYSEYFWQALLQKAVRTALKFGQLWIEDAEPTVQNNTPRQMLLTGRPFVTGKVEEATSENY
jgi:hypothetical protein